MRSPLAAVAVAAALVAAAPVQAQDRIPEPDLQRHLQALAQIAAENGGNRASGTPGETRTGGDAADRLAEAGWTVTRTDVPFDFWAEGEPSVVGSYRHGLDFVTLHYSGAGDVTARIRAIRGSGCLRRDFRRFRRGQIAVVAASFCTFRRAAVLGQRAGASAVLSADFTNGPPTAGTMIRPGVRVPVVGIRLPIARRLARSRPRLRVRVTPIAERRVTQNVIAELPGTQPDRVVMAGGHMDSVPRGAGINDNGSGVAALIEMGRRLAAQPRGRATLRLAFWAAHENGTYGSQTYVRGLPPAERRRIGAYLNMDMVGSINGVPEIYATRRRIRRTLARHLRGAGRISANSGSDHMAFMRAGIPVGGIYTGSLEPKSGRERRRWGGRAGIERDGCYHQPCDDVDNINLPMLSLTATAGADALAELARSRSAAASSSRSRPDWSARSVS
jgi:hypothetical protein